MVFSRVGDCAEITYNPRAPVREYTWILVMDLPESCSIIEFKWIAEHGSGHQQWENWQPGGNRQINVKLLKQRNQDVIYTSFNQKQSKTLYHKDCCVKMN